MFEASSIFPGRQRYNLGEDFFRLCSLSSRCHDAPHNLRLPVGRDWAVARESSQYAFVTEVLAPNLEFLRRKLELIGDLDQRVAETVRVGPRKAPRSKGVLKDAAVVSTWGQLDSSRAVIQSSKAAVNSNEIALDSVRQEAEVGQRTTFDILFQQQQLLNARVVLVSAQRDRVVASYAVMAAIGRLSAANLNLSVMRYDPTVHFDQVKDKWIGLRTPDGR